MTSSAHRRVYTNVNKIETVSTLQISSLAKSDPKSIEITNHNLTWAGQEYEPTMTSREKFLENLYNLVFKSREAIVSNFNYIAVCKCNQLVLWLHKGNENQK